MLIGILSVMWILIFRLFGMFVIDKESFKRLSEFMFSK